MLTDYLKHTRCIQINSDIIVTSPTRSSGKKATVPN